MTPLFPKKMTITERLNDITKQASALSRDVAALPDGADPMQLLGALSDLITAVSAAQSRINTRPNETISKPVVQEETLRQIAELERQYSIPSQPIQARLEVERSHLLGLTADASHASTVAWKDELSVLEQLDGQTVTVTWDPVLGMGRIDATEAAAAAFLKG